MIIQDVMFRFRLGGTDTSVPLVLGESREREGGQTPPAEEGEGADTQNILENTDKGREGKEGKKGR